MENLIGKSFKTLVRTDENGNKTVEILPNLKGEEMKRVNFREVNKKLIELKQAELKAKSEYLFSELGSEDENWKGLVLNGTRDKLEQFRNTKISEGI